MPATPAARSPLGALLHAARLARGLTQAQAAEKAGAELATLQWWEVRARTISAALISYAWFLGIDAEDVLIAAHAAGYDGRTLRRAGEPATLRRLDIRASIADRARRDLEHRRARAGSGGA